MTKRDLVLVVSKNTGLDINTVEKVVIETFEVIKDNLRKGKRVHVPMFGVFYVKRAEGKHLKWKKPAFEPSYALKNEIKSHEIKKEVCK